MKKKCLAIFNPLYRPIDCFVEIYQLKNAFSLTPFDLKNLLEDLSLSREATSKFMYHCPFVCEL